MHQRRKINHNLKQPQLVRGIFSVSGGIYGGIMTVRLNSLTRRFKFSSFSSLKPGFEGLTKRNL